MVRGVDAVLVVSALFIIGVIVSLFLRILDKKRDIKTPHIYVVWRDEEHKHQVDHWAKCWCKTGASYEDTYELASNTFKSLVGLRNVNMDKVVNASEAQDSVKRATDAN